jgi:hypothetical protein
VSRDAVARHVYARCRGFVVCRQTYNHVIVARSLRYVCLECGNHKLAGEVRDGCRRIVGNRAPFLLDVHYLKICRMGLGCIRVWFVKSESSRLRHMCLELGLGWPRCCCCGLKWQGSANQIDSSPSGNLRSLLLAANKHSTNNSILDLLRSTLP